MNRSFQLMADLLLNRLVLDLFEPLLEVVDMNNCRDIFISILGLYREQKMEKVI